MGADLPDLPDHEERMAAARRRAQWEIGDPSWAAVIVRAYLRPEADARSLAQDQAE